MSDASAAASTPRSPWISVTILFAVWTIAFIDRFVLLLLVPGMKATLHITDTQVALLQGPAFAVVFAIAGVIMGRFVDSANRRNLILAGLVGWTLAAVACGLSGSFAALFVARMVIGVCQAVLAPASFSLVADLFPAERRGKPIAVLTAAASTGSALAQMLGGTLLGVFVGKPALRLPGGAALLPWQTTMVVTALPGFLFAVLLLLVREPSRGAGRVAAAPAFDLVSYLRRHRALFAMVLAAFGIQFIVAYGVASWFAVLLIRNSGLMPAQAGLLMGGMTLACGFVAGSLGGWLSDRAARADPQVGRFRLAVGCLIVEALAFVPLIQPHVLPTLIGGFALYAITGTMVAAYSYTILPELVPGAGRGRILALHQFIAIMLGFGLGPLLIALFTDRVFHDEAKINYSIMCVAMPCAAVAASLLAAAVPRARALRRAMEAGGAI